MQKDTHPIGIQGGRGIYFVYCGSGRNYNAAVVVGNPKTFTTDQPTLTQPPTGFNSVGLISFPLELFVTFWQIIGGPSSTGSLNYDELIVYTNGAVRPAYLVVYDS